MDLYFFSTGTTSWQTNWGNLFLLPTIIIILTEQNSSLLLPCKNWIYLNSLYSHSNKTYHVLIWGWRIVLLQEIHKEGGSLLGYPGVSIWKLASWLCLRAWYSTPKYKVTILHYTIHQQLSRSTESQHLLFWRLWNSLVLWGRIM